LPTGIPHNTYWRSVSLGTNSAMPLSQCWTRTSPSRRLLIPCWKERRNGAPSFPSANQSWLRRRKEKESRAHSKWEMQTSARRGPHSSRAWRDTAAADCGPGGYAVTIATAAVLQFAMRVSAAGWGEGTRLIDLSLSIGA